MAAVSIDLTPIIQAVAAETTVDASAETLLDQLTAQLQAVAAQPAQSVAALQAQIQQLANQMQTNRAGLVAAVSANTPAAATTEEGTTEEATTPWETTAD